VFVQCGAGVLKLDKTTGKTLWRIADSASGMSAGAFSSPVLATLAGQRQLLVQTRQELTGIDLSTGDVLWAVVIPAFRGMNILTPLVIDDCVFTCSYGGGAFLYAIHRDGDDWQVSQVWMNKTEGYMSSPVLVDDHIYVHLKNQRVACIDHATGAETWRSKPFGKYWSMAVNGNQILALDQRGELLLIEANPEELQIADRRKLPSDDAWAHIAVSGNQVFVRELNSLAVYLWE
jgi:outer membrane protein assembly factor BamB